TIRSNGQLELGANADTVGSLAVNAGGRVSTLSKLLTVTGLTTFTGTTGDDTLAVTGTTLAPFSATFAGQTIGSISPLGGLSFDGAGGTDTLAGPNGNNLWSINGANAGALIAGISLAFTNVENLTGNARADQFVFEPGGGVAGTIDGGADVDELVYNVGSTPVSVNLGLGVSGLSAALAADQAVPASASTATGTATVSNYDPAARTFDVSITVSGIVTGEVTGLEI